MAEKKDGVIGFDPLAWMKDGSHESPAVSRQSEDHGHQSPAVSRQSTSKTDDQRPATGHSPGTVALGETLTIEQAAALHAELGRHLTASTVVLEAGALTRVDTAGLQLLAAFVRAADERGANIEWRAPSEPLRAAARLAGLAPALRLI